MAKSDRQMRQRMTALWASYGLMLLGAIVFSYQANNALERIEDEACVSAIGPLLNLDADEIRRYANNGSFDDVLRVVDLVEERCSDVLGVKIEFQPITVYCDDPRNECDAGRLPGE